jgi:hypothetical protein
VRIWNLACSGLGAVNPYDFCTTVATVLTFISVGICISSSSGVLLLFSSTDGKVPRLQLLSLR